MRRSSGRGQPGAHHINTDQTVVTKQAHIKHHHHQLIGVYRLQLFFTIMLFPKSCNHALCGKAHCPQLDVVQ